MYSAPLHDKETLPHQREREEWARRLRREQAAPELPCAAPERTTPQKSVPGLSGDAALVGLILFLLSDRTKKDGFLLCVLIYLLFS